MKSCVGSTWCRYGVQDSVGARRSRSSCATAACARRTRSSSASPAAPASAPRPAARTSASSPPRRAGTSTSAATAASPRATPSCSPSDLDTETLVRYIDRFLMYYVRTADRLQRTAPWIEDARGRPRPRARGRRRRLARHRAPSSRRRWRAHVDSYEDEWARDPRRPGEAGAGSSPSSTRPTTPDPDLAYVPERGQPRPATVAERAAGPGDPIRDPLGRHRRNTGEDTDGSGLQPTPGRPAHEPDDAVLIAGPRLEVVSR